MIIDEHTNLDGDAGEATARALQQSLPRKMWNTSYRDVAFASHPSGWRSRWLWPRLSAVSVETADVSLGGIGSHEAAIAKVEQHFHGPHGAKAPADPLCHRSTVL
ncbi:MAG TPA: hypothetical protein VNZ50_04290 [Hyphomicrobiaceae bacterium]|nr:hypothetical protein [Hyphomicrobiaceae bacterium]